MIVLYKEPITATQLAGECGSGTGVDRMEGDSKTFTGMGSLEGRIQRQEESSGRDTFYILGSAVTPAITLSLSIKAFKM